MDAKTDKSLMDKMVEEIGEAVVLLVTEQIPINKNTIIDMLQKKPDHIYGGKYVVRSAINLMKGGE